MVKVLVWFLVVLGFLMAGLALNLDLHDFVETPWYLWPWVPICALYPFLLALNYLYFLWKGEFPWFFLSFTVFGALGYGLIAPLFYTLYMVETGFGWYELGNIFWVWLYAAQAYFLLRYVRGRGRFGRLPVWQLGLILGYFLTKDLLDRFSTTWSYVRFGMISDELMNISFIALLFIHTFLFLYLVKKPK